MTRMAVPLRFLNPDAPPGHEYRRDPYEVVVLPRCHGIGVTCSRRRISSTSITALECPTTVTLQPGPRADCGRGLEIVAALCAGLSHLPDAWRSAAGPDDPAIGAGGCCTCCRPANAVGGTAAEEKERASHDRPLVPAGRRRPSVGRRR
jgi:hypothetical protein